MLYMIWNGEILACSIVWIWQLGIIKKCCKHAHFLFCGVNRSWWPTLIFRHILHHISLNIMYTKPCQYLLQFDKLSFWISTSSAKVKLQRSLHLKIGWLTDAEPEIYTLTLVSHGQRFGCCWDFSEYPVVSPRSCMFLGIGVWLGICAQKCLRGQTGNFRRSRHIARHRVYFNVLSKKCGDEFI
jgi:hypothetical protein